MVVLMSKSIPGNKNEYSANISLKAIPGSSYSITKKKNTIYISLLWGKTFTKSNSDAKESPFV